MSGVDWPLAILLGVVFVVTSVVRWQYFKRRMRRKDGRTVGQSNSQTVGQSDSRTVGQSDSRTETTKGTPD